MGVPTLVFLWKSAIKLLDVKQFLQINKELIYGMVTHGKVKSTTEDTGSRREINWMIWFSSTVLSVCVCAHGDQKRVFDP